MCKLVPNSLATILWRSKLENCQNRWTKWAGKQADGDDEQADGDDDGDKQAEK